MSKKKVSEKNEQVIILPKKKESYIFASGIWSKRYGEEFTRLMENPILINQDFIFLCRGKVNLDEIFFKTHGVSISSSKKDNCNLPSAPLTKTNVNKSALKISLEGELKC
jgi:hypothetical protein